jgi:SPP1 gp7 family putative phage head morphogenesis protein
MGFLDWLLGKKPSHNAETTSKSQSPISAEMIIGGSPRQDEARKAGNNGKYTKMGNTEPICPYCNYRFDKMPQRKKKCPMCANFVYSRTRPLDNKKVLIKQDQIDELESQWTKQKGSETLQFNLVNSKAILFGEKWRDTLIKSGGSYRTEIDVDGVARQVFNPWLAGATLSERERIADILTSSITTGKGIKAIAKELKAIPAIKKDDAERVASQVTKYFYHSATMQRFREEEIKQGVWHTIDPVEKGHVHLNGKKFRLGDPIWNLMLEDGCKCWVEPVIPEKI